MQRIIGILLILIFLPVWLIIIVFQLVVFKNMFFYQRRIGKGGKPFDIVKFQSLTTQQGNEVDAQRLNWWGRVLRNSSLDEIPQFINIIKGEMVLVGPRPLLPEYMALYTPRQSRRHEVKPGITGWAQVQGRSSLSWSDQFELDVWYVDHKSIGLDLRILGLTILKLFKRTPEENQMRKAFNGKN